MRLKRASVRQMQDLLLGSKDAVKSGQGALRCLRGVKSCQVWDQGCEPDGNLCSVLICFPENHIR